MMCTTYIEFSNRDFFQNGKFFWKKYTKETKKLAQLLRLPLCHNLDTALVQSSKIDFTWFVYMHTLLYNWLFTLDLYIEI